MGRYGVFAPLKLAGQIDDRTKPLEGLSVHDQLVKRRVCSIQIKALARGKAFLVSDSKLKGFRMLLDQSRRAFWSIDVGHELAHTFFFDINASQGAPRRNKGWFWSREEEEFCEWFGFHWAATGNNHKETMALLDSFLKDNEPVSQET